MMGEVICLKGERKFQWVFAEDNKLGSVRK